MVLAGDGSDLERLRSIAKEHPGRGFSLGRPSTPLPRAVHPRSIFVLFGAIEDLGFMPVESKETGTPVVASAIGGAAETVVDCGTGVLFRTTGPAELRLALEAAMATAPASRRERASEFDGLAFGARIRDWMGL